MICFIDSQGKAIKAEQKNIDEATRTFIKSIKKKIAPAIMSKKDFRLRRTGKKLKFRRYLYYCLNEKSRLSHNRF